MFELEAHKGPAVIDAERGTTLEFPDLVLEARHSLEPLGAKKTFLFAFCENSVASLRSYTGALLTNHTVALLDAAARPNLKAGVVREFRAPWVTGPPNTSVELAAEGVGLADVIATPDQELIRTEYPLPESVHPDLALLLSTSGTTGSTKLVRLSRRNLESNAAAIAEYLELTPDERPITSLPLHYTFGLSVVNSHWTVGAPVVLTPLSLMQQPFWNVFRENDCTSMAGVPFSYQMLDRVGFRDMDLPTLGTLIQAGGALDHRLQREYHRFMDDRGGRFFVMYGQTEATARISYVPHDQLPDKIGSAGIAIPGGHISLGTEDGPLTVAGITGEVVYEGPNVMMGYAESREDLERGDELDGVLRTGDLGQLDEDGYLFLTGRSKRIAKVFGLRINLDEIELRLREHGPAAVVGEDDTIRAFCAFGDESSLKELGVSLAKEFKIRHTAISLEWVSEIPTTSSDKIDYKRLGQ